MGELTPITEVDGRTLSTVPVPKLLKNLLNYSKAPTESGVRLLISCELKLSLSDETNIHEETHPFLFALYRSKSLRRTLAAASHRCRIPFRISKWHMCVGSWQLSRDSVKTAVSMQWEHPEQGIFIVYIDGGHTFDMVVSNGTRRYKGTTMP